MGNQKLLAAHSSYEIDLDLWVGYKAQQVRYVSDNAGLGSERAASGVGRSGYQQENICSNPVSN